MASGVYRITPVGTYRGFDVYCDMNTDDGGWLVCFILFTLVCNMVI